MLKAIEVEFKTKKFLINQWVVLINRYTSEQIHQIIERGMKNVFKMKKGQQQEDMLYIMQTIMECYKGGHNFIRKTIIRHCMNLVQKDIFSQSELTEMEVYMERLDTIANWEWHVKKSTRCRFVYWLRSLQNVFLKNIIMNDKHNLYQMYYY